MQTKTQLYHYTMCGLDNVYLENGYTHTQTTYGLAVKIEDSEGLDRAIAVALINGNAHLNGKEIRFMRTMIGMSQGDLAAQWLNKDAQTIARWEKGTNQIPCAEEMLFRLFSKAFLDGNETVRQAVHSLNFIDRVKSQPIVLSKADGHWVPSTQVIEPEKYTG